MNFPDDSFTFRGRIQARTEGGAYLIRDDSGHRSFLPVTWVTVEPTDFALEQTVEITLPRALARKKGFLRDAGQGQEKLL